MRMCPNGRLLTKEVSAPLVHNVHIVPNGFLAEGVAKPARRCKDSVASSHVEEEDLPSESEYQQSEHGDQSEMDAADLEVDDDDGDLFDFGQDSARATKAARALVSVGMRLG